MEITTMFDKGKKIAVKSEGEGGFLYYKFTKVDHPFLQKLAESEGILTNIGGEFTFLACESIVLFFIYENSIELECISTPVESRGKGSATNVMKFLTKVSDETGIPITLRATNVTGNGWMMMQHIGIAHGMVKKNKIPVAKLPKWYQKFGFEIFSKAKKGVNMIYFPKNKNSLSV